MKYSFMLMTEEEWLSKGYEIIPGETSLHKDKNGNSLWRLNQVMEQMLEAEDIPDMEEEI